MNETQSRYTPDNKDFKDALDLLSPHDIVKRPPPELLAHGYESFTIYFKATEHDNILSMDVYENGTFKIGGSTTTPTARFIAYATGYSRALAVIEALGLRANL